MTWLGLKSGSRHTLLITTVAAVVHVGSLIPWWMVHPTNSDDTYLSVILRSWRPFSEHATRVRDDTYLLHWPFYLVGDNLLGQSRSTLFLISIVMNLISLVLVVRFLNFVVRRLTDSQLVTSLTVGCTAIWYASTAGPATDLLVRPSFRNLELGLVLLLIQLAVETGEQPRPSRWRCVMVVGIGGLLMVDDPLNIYVILATAAVVGVRSVAPYRRSSQRLITVSLLGAGIVCFIAIRVILRALGFEVLAVPTTIIPLDDIWTSTATTAHWTLNLLGADVFARDIKDPHTLVMAFRLTFLAGVGWLAYSARGRQVVGDLTVEVSLVAFGAVLFAQTFSSNGYGAGNGRYLALCVPLAAVVIASVIARAEPTTRAGLVAAVAIVVVANIALSFRSFNDARGAQPDGEAQASIATLESNGLTHGYADYWESYAYTYLSVGRVEILETICIAGESSIRYGNVNRYQAELPSSFFLLDSRAGLTACGLNDIKRQFGVPASTLQVSATKVALIYDYDIGSRITRQVP